MSSRTISRISKVLLVLGLLGSVAACKKESSAPAVLGNFHRYPMEHAHVKYAYSGLGRGVEELFFDQYGKREAKIANWEHIEDKGMRQRATLNLTLGSDIYTCQLDRRQGIHFKDGELDSLFHLSPAETPSPESASETYLQQRATKIGTDTISGFLADVWKITDAPVELSIWRGVLLKRTSMMPGDTVIMSAVSVDTISTFEPATFVVPASIQIKERPADGGLPTF